VTDTSPTIASMKAESGAALPESHVEYARVDEELFTSYLAWRSTILDTGVIPRHQKLLMVVALMTAQKSIEPLKLYAAIARSQGATVQELKEALRVGILFSGGAGIDAASHVVHLIEEGSGSVNAGSGVTDADR
jgi:alkylhydroperoxidase/carboxymuconolactone decarboxylase family protein YurZ